MKAVGYIRVSSAEQVEGYSLDVQERDFFQHCEAKGWEPVGVYWEEGKSAHTDAISRRPVFKQLLDDASRGTFDVVVVHTADRWARNTRVALNSVAILARHSVVLTAVNGSLDYSTPEGRLFMTILSGFNEYFSDNLGTHTRKGVEGRASKSLHAGSLPFGYESCYENGLLRCEEEHPGGVHVVHEEEEAVRELFRRHASGSVTLSQLASWMNSQGFRTRNTKSLANGSGTASSGPKLFTTASVRGILHNPFFMGQVRHRKELLPGPHEGLVSEDVFQAVQAAMKRNSGRSETLHPRPEREYLLKGLIKCAYCGMSLWAQTLVSGSRLYREQHRSRSHAECRADGKSIRCDIPDEQMGRIVSAIVLPDAWMDRVLAQIQLADEVKRVAQERKDTEQRLKRLGQVYLDGVMPEGEYQRQKRLLHDWLASLVVPGVDAAKEAGLLLENLPALWEAADLGEAQAVDDHAGRGLRGHGGGEGHRRDSAQAGLPAAVRGRDHPGRQRRGPDLPTGNTPG